MSLLKSYFDSNDYRRTFWALFIFTLLIMLLGLGLRSPWPADEPRFVEVAREMVSSGQWLFPSRGGEFYPDKPPVFMWSIALCYIVIGNLKLAFLIPNALCGLLTTMLVFDLGARLWNVRTGRNAALLLLLVPQFLIQAKNAQIDAMVMCWITVGCYGLIRHFFVGPSWRWYFVSWAFMGLGIITKGVGFLPLLMLLPIALYTWRSGLYRERWQWRAALGPLVMLAVIGCWLVPMVVTVLSSGDAQHLAYMNNILFKQTGQRYVAAWHHIKPWYYFIVSVIPWMWLPLPLLVIAYWRRLVTAIKADPRIAILLLWVALVVLFFSISPGKRNVYILPALPMACLAITAALQQATVCRWFERLVKGLLWLLGGITLALAVAALRDHPVLVRKLADYTDDLAHVGYFILTVAIGWLALLVLARKQLALLQMGFITLFVWAISSSWGYSLLEHMRTPKDVTERVAATIGEQGQLGLIDFKEQFILFSTVDITHFSYLAPLAEQERNAWFWQQQGEQRYLLVPADAQLSCFDLSKGQDMGEAHREHWFLLAADARRADCPKPDVTEVFFTPKPGTWMME